MSQNVVNPYRYAVTPVVYGTITGDGGGEVNARIHRGLGFTLSDTLWVCEFELESTSLSGALTLPVCFTANTDVCAETGAANDAMGFYYNGNWNGFQRLVSSLTACGYIAGTANSPRYITMARQSATALQIDVYTDEARTTHDNSTCASCCIPNYGILNLTIDSAVDNLAYIQSSTDQEATPSQNYTVKDIKVWDGTNDTSGTIDFHGTATGWTQVGTVVTIA